MQSRCETKSFHAPLHLSRICNIRPRTLILTQHDNLPPHPYQTIHSESHHATQRIVSVCSSQVYFSSYSQQCAWNYRGYAREGSNLGVRGDRPPSVVPNPEYTTPAPSPPSAEPASLHSETHHATGRMVSVCSS